MHAQLMGATGERLERKPSEGTAFVATGGRKPRAPHHLPRGHRRLTRRIVLLPPAARRVFAAEGQLDAAFILRRPARDHRPIGLADLPALEQAAEGGQRLAMAAEHQAAGGVAIETMGERGRARQAETQRAKMIFEALAALRPFVNGQARRLVDHQHQAVAIDEPSHYLFRSHGHLPRFGETAITTMIASEAGDYGRSIDREAKLVAAA